MRAVTWTASKASMYVEFGDVVRRDWFRRVLAAEEPIVCARSVGAMHVGCARPSLTGSETQRPRDLADCVDLVGAEPLPVVVA